MPKFIVYLRRLVIGLSNKFVYTCPICNFHGKFKFAGIPLRVGVSCPTCNSVERHRLFYLKFKTNSFLNPILHFAAEDCLKNYLFNNNSEYFTADLYTKSDFQLNIESIKLKDSSFGTVIANHVLEHVDDNKALSEIHRILIKGGYFICSIPQIKGLVSSFRPKDALSYDERILYCGQSDHLRTYGDDFEDFVSNYGFILDRKFSPSLDEKVQYSLNFNDTIYFFKKL